MPNAQARAMRRAPTESERLLWSRLRDRRLRGFKFRRQHPIGQFIADFACMERRLIVEADGGQHADSEYDALRAECYSGQP
jgi:very-short-patch-repair endonuclease